MRGVWAVLSCAIVAAHAARNAAPAWSALQQSSNSPHIAAPLQPTAQHAEDEAPAHTKFIIVTGGVMSGIGKGITASSVGLLLKMMGFRPTAVKIDPYLNIDAGTISPLEHGEVFVLDDGSETDLDLGNYERFMRIRLTKDSSLTTGKIYQSVLAKERKGDFLGKTVQVVPHITDAIQEWIIRVGAQPVDGCGARPDVVVIELGGTIGDIESMPFVEALRQLQHRLGHDHVCFMHVSHIPELSGEQKTKPTQHSVKEIRAMGILPDFLVCRSKSPLSSAARNKLSLFCQVPAEQVHSVYDMPNLYHVPLVLEQQGLPKRLLERLKLFKHRHHPSHSDSIIQDKQMLQSWAHYASAIDNAKDVVSIALVGKYSGEHDSYLSVVKALSHAAVAQDQRLDIRWINSEHLESKATDTEASRAAWTALETAHAILIPGGFGVRGVEGKVAAVSYARKSMKPFLGICLGMQAAVIEFARNELGMAGANSEEFASHLNSNQSAVIFMPEGSKEVMGGTMRVGGRRSVLRSGTLAHKLYGRDSIWERHRHRYEVNPSLVASLEAAGLVVAATDETGQRTEIIELPTHPFFLGVQFHPEFLSWPGSPSPCFQGFLAAARRHKQPH